MNVPKLRFKEFSGEWEEKSFRDIVSLNLVPTEKPSSDYVRLGIRSHCKGTFHELVKIENVLEADKIFLVPKDNLILNITFAWEHAIAITDENDEGKYVSGRFPTFSFKSEELPAFYESIIRSKRMKYELGVASPGGAGRNRVLNKELFLDIPVNTTNIEEQTKISNFIRCIDDKIKNQKDIIESLEKQKKGLMQKIFSQELRFKDEDGKEFPAWEEKFIKEICSISTGKSNTQDKVDSGAYPFYVRSSVVEKSEKYLYDEEAVLTVGDGVGTGKIYHYINGKYDLHQRVYRMYDFVGVSAKYFYFYFSSHFYDRVSKMSAKNSVDSVRLNMIADMRISVPCMGEQTKIVEVLTGVERQLNISKEVLEHWRQIKKGLLQQMFV